MTMLDQQTGASFEKMLHDADDFRERIEIEIEKAIADVDPRSPDAETCRAMLRQIRTTLPEVSLPQLMKVAALDATMKGAIFATIKATLAVIGPPPMMLPLGSASDVLEIFSPMIADVERARLN